MRLEESTANERQTHYALENFKGLDDVGKEITKLSDEYKKIEKRISSTTQEEDFTRLDQIKKRIDILWVVLTVKMNNVVAHAINGNSIGPLRMIVNFMDAYSVNSKVISESIQKLANTRYVSGGFLDICAVIAARQNDFQFIKDLEAFAEKNKGRMSKIATKQWESDMDDYNITGFESKNRIAFEALINGHEAIYKHMTDGKGIDTEYMVKFINKSSHSWNQPLRLTKQEVMNVVGLEPSFLALIQQEMPENVTDGVQDVMDLFLF